MEEAVHFFPLWGPAERFQHRRGLVKREDNDRVEKDGREARGEGQRALTCSRGVVTVAQEDSLGRTSGLDEGCCALRVQSGEDRGCERLGGGEHAL